MALANDSSDILSVEGGTLGDWAGVERRGWYSLSLLNVSTLRGARGADVRVLAALERRPARPREIARGNEDAKIPSGILMEELDGGFGEVRIKWGVNVAIASWRRMSNSPAQKWRNRGPQTCLARNRLSLGV